MGKSFNSHPYKVPNRYTNGAAVEVPSYCPEPSKLNTTNLEPVTIGEDLRVKATKSGFSSLGMKSEYRKFKNYLKRQPNWVENMQRTLMLVAMLTATISFQVAVSPPSGV
ncbi:hypothetical protein J1N35_031361 [Gossypium stocksii]|uniref:PGG domain-containing protein n=1 Tax=Gossypium stocksii TaxID=47602 RepID=A0A9D3V2D9_9ROSI|nr:hypothetical protein J1N35_031361 [Gossypium stocksii]